MTKEEKDKEMGEFLKFFFELGQLKQIKRSGWNLIGIENPESVAEHSFRSAVIAFFIAKKEGADPYKSAAMCLFHSIPETRIGDLHKVGQRYLDKKSAVPKIIEDQFRNLPGASSESIVEDYANYAKDTSKEGIVARDADFLECAITAKEYIDRGYPDAVDWINNVDTVVKTETAKKLSKMIFKSDSNSWWKGLKKIGR